jgi:sulfite reductase (ferredoxin)
MTKEKKPSAVEGIKETSIYLKGDLLEELAEDNGGKVSNEAYELLKFHGSYFGYDRDTATERKKAKLEKEWEFMIRVKAPAGRFTADQYLKLDEMAENYADGTLRVTTRQTFQFHCIAKDNLKNHIAGINDILLTTFGGCGDVVRNVMAAPSPRTDIKTKKLLEDAFKINDYTMPNTSAYHEIWVDGENLARSADSENYEPLYGKYYLPRKFKIGLIVPEDNTIDVFTHDLGFVLVYEGEELKGYNVYLGGGLGMTHNKADTFPRLASPICFVEPDDLLKITEAVIKLYRDHGNRTNRKRARLKYVIADNGVEWTKKTLEEYYGSELEDCREVGEIQVVDHMGWHEQGDGKLYLGVPVPSGRVADRDGMSIRSGLYKVVEKYRPNLIMTSDQNVILADIDPADKSEIENTLRSHRIKLVDEISRVRRNMLACVALPTCGKALAEAERIKIPFVDELEKVMNKHGIPDDKIAIRIAGCPNGCSRPYAGEIGIVGRTPEHYAIFLGGNFEGTRLTEKTLDRVPYDNLHELFDFLFGKYVAERTSDGEQFGNYCHRIGNDNVIAAIKEQFAAEYKWAV